MKVKKKSTVRKGTILLGKKMKNIVVMNLIHMSSYNLQMGNLKMVFDTIQIQTSITCKISSAFQPIFMTVFLNIRNLVSSGFTSNIVLKMVAYSVMTWVSVKQCKLLSYSKVCLTLSRSRRC